MKTLKKTIRRITIVLAIVLISTPTWAKRPPAKNKYVLATEQKQELRQVLDREVEFPEIARTYGITGYVKAQLEVTAEGKLAIQAINGHPDLIPSVEKQVSKINIEDYTLVGSSKEKGVNKRKKGRKTIKRRGKEGKKEKYEKKRTRDEKKK
eukprot:Anaeramoba_ignava/a234352_4.p1 GENE.a234352_4~~a234352_4.p1  ORF type:complete len:152 (-),score=23.90 a234352_4:49-504(-)